MRRALSAFILLFMIAGGRAKGQQFALYNTGTLFDTFEIPSRSAFQTDSSRQYAFNFFIPSGGVNYGTSGPGTFTLKKVMYTGVYDTRQISETEDKLTKETASENTYLLMFKLFKSVKYHRELGFSWQVKTDSRGETTNQTLIVFQNYQRVINDQETDADFTNTFKTKIYAQSYHQFSFTYRENYNKRLSYGFKLSYLSGIAYSKLLVNSSRLEFISDSADYFLTINGDLRTTTYYDDIHRKDFMPGFKNPGAAVGFSAAYKGKNGWNIIGNIKDLGFIKWSSKAYMYRANDFQIKAKYAGDSLWRKVKQDLRQEGYVTPVNGKAEVLLNKDLDFYQPNLLLSKNLFYKGGDMALVNTFRYRSLNFSITTAYNMDKMFMLGGQLMIKSPNVEFYLGSDQLANTYHTGQSFASSDETIGNDHPGASFYMGFALKFGRVMSRQQNENYIPGINLKVREKNGFFQKIFGKRAE